MLLIKKYKLLNKIVLKAQKKYLTNKIVTIP